MLLRSRGLGWVGRSQQDAPDLFAGDRTLLTSFREGRAEALERVYRHHVAQVTRFLSAGFAYIGGGVPKRFAGFRQPLELEAVVQATFVRAFSASARQGYDGVRPYAAFLLGIARNVALRELERRSAEGERIEPLDDHLEELESPAEVMEDRLDRERRRRLVESFLAAATETDRRLFELRWGRGLSQEAAARAAGLTRIQVRRWESKLRARLLRHLKRAGYFEEEP